MWAALALAVRRADGRAVTHIVDGAPVGDAAIQRDTAAALQRRGFLRIAHRGRLAAPTEGGRRALATHLRLQARRAAREARAEETPS